MDPANPQNQNPVSNPAPASTPEATPPPTQSPSQSPALTPSWAETTPDVPESPKLPDMTIKSEDTPPPTPNTPGASKKTNWPAVLLAVLLVFALGGVGILAMQNYQLGKQIENLQVETKETPVPTLPPMPTPTATANPTLDWKTYTNSKYGFEFRYPEIYKESLTNSSSYGTNLLQLKHSENNSTIDINLDTNKFTVEYLKKYAPTGQEEVSPMIKNNYGNNTFYYYGAGGGGVNYPDLFFYNLNGQVLSFVFDGPYAGTTKSPSEDTIFVENQLLTSFKTTTVSSSPSPSPTP